LVLWNCNAGVTLRVVVDAFEVLDDVCFDAVCGDAVWLVARQPLELTNPGVRHHGLDLGLHVDGLTRGFHAATSNGPNGKVDGGDDFGRQLLDDDLGRRGDLDIRFEASSPVGNEVRLHAIADPLDVACCFEQPK
jgi:hypothetical protein